MEGIIPDKLTSFLRMMLPERTELLKRIEKECRDEYIPLVAPETGQYLQVMVKAFKPNNILEVGTGIGYSAILLASANDNKTNITTIEIDSERYKRACQNIVEAGLQKKITPLLGNASEVIPTLCNEFDLIFMDAAKGQYPDFFEKLWPLLKSGGILIVDNIFLGGWVIDMTWPERRKKTMVCRVREFLEMLKNHPDLSTSLIPLGDGLVVSARR